MLQDVFIMASKVYMLEFCKEFYNSFSHGEMLRVWFIFLSTLLMFIRFVSSEKYCSFLLYGNHIKLLMILMRHL